MSNKPMSALESNQIHALLSARSSLIYIICSDEPFGLDCLTQVVKERGQQLYCWDFARGWSDLKGSSKGNPMAGLQRIPGNKSSIFVMKDIALSIAPSGTGRISSNQIAIVREIKNVVSDIRGSRCSLIVLSESCLPPTELKSIASVIEIRKPNQAAIACLVQQMVGSKITCSDSELTRLYEALQGLTREEIRRALAYTLARNGTIDCRAIAVAIEAKKECIKQTEILELIEGCPLSSIGGKDKLKWWIRSRGRALSQAGRDYNLPCPRGVLIAGVQGTGKSTICKAIANEWMLPLLRLDVGRLFGGIVGQSEARIREAIALAEAVAPCVLMLDEIDKAFGGVTSGGNGDSGTSKRVFGTLLTWMQEKQSTVFIAATANNVRSLPAELIRKGRLDEIFFVGLPEEKERFEVFRICLARFRPDRGYDCTYFASLTEGFSGAEIEQCVIDAMYRGFSRGEEFCDRDILDAISHTSPLSRIASQQIEDLLAWAAEAGAELADEPPKTLFPEENKPEIEVDGDRHGRKE